MLPLSFPFPMDWQRLDWSGAMATVHWRPSRRASFCKNKLMTVCLSQTDAALAQFLGALCFSLCIYIWKYMAVHPSSWSRSSIWNWKSATAVFFDHSYLVEDIVIVWILEIFIKTALVWDALWHFTCLSTNSECCWDIFVFGDLCLFLSICRSWRKWSL